MAFSVRAAALGFKPVPLCARSSDSSSITPSSLSFKRSFSGPNLPLRLSFCPRSSRKFTVVPFAASGEATEAEEATGAATAEQEGSEIEDPIDNNSETETDSSVPLPEENPNSALIATLNSYKEALANKDQTKIKEIETYLLSIEEESVSLSDKVGTLTGELKTEHERLLRISADFDNFRKRTEKEKYNLMDNVKGEVIENLLPVLDNFERAKAQIKVETEGEKKINESYQSIYKQFVETLTSLGVKDVETVGNPFDPMFHEAIMREDSTEYEEGIILQEFRKGFRLGDRLLRPAMVKVSAGPGPAKSDDTDMIDMEDGVLPHEKIGDSSEDGGEDGADSD
ncbi:grpE protein [Carex littledalei]|uniref:GrpE protein homolog n=1 Tax=Carex littledalei TaxID=544730 RepID=A0A833VZK5_9POAL|nr:grpE protein [Carex littledalei]